TRPGTQCFMTSNTRFEIPSSFEYVKTIGSGAYGVVISATNAQSGKTVAIKNIQRAFDDLTDAKRIVREIKLMRHLHHKCVLGVEDIFEPVSLAKFEDVYIVSQLMATDLHRVIYSRHALSDEHIAFFMYQMLCAMKYVHSANVIHRDLKPSNVLVNANCELKICDFGLARGVFPEEELELTEYVVTRWYRAPEIMLGCMKYTREVDVWSMGCIFAEMMSRKPLFPGQDYIDQLHLIMNALGAPNDQELYFLTNARARKFMNAEFHKRGPTPTKPLAQLFTEISPDALDLLEKMLVIDPNKRISIDDALAHPYVASIRNVEDETTASTSFDFDFENEKLTKPVLQKLIWDEMKAFHPTASEEDGGDGDNDSFATTQASITPVTPVTPATIDPEAEAQASAPTTTSEALATAKVTTPATAAAQPEGDVAAASKDEGRTNSDGRKSVDSGKLPTDAETRQEAGEPAREDSIRPPKLNVGSSFSAMKCSLVIGICFAVNVLPSVVIGDFPSSVAKLMDVEVDPCGDFYQYACGGWERDTVIPADKPSVDLALTAIKDRNEVVVQEIAHENWPLIGELWDSCMDMDTLDALGNTPLQEALARIKGAESKTELIQLAGEFRRTGVAVFADVTVGPDSRNATANVLYVHSPKLTLPDLSYYTDADAFAVLEPAFREYIGSILTLSGYLDHDDSEGSQHQSVAVDTVLTIEQQLANAQTSPTKERNPGQSPSYHPITLRDATERFPASFNHFARGLGLLDMDAVSIGLTEETEVLFQSFEYFDRIEELLVQVSLPDLKLYMAFAFSHFHARYLSSNFCTAYFEFFGKTLSGQQTMWPRSRACVHREVEYLPDLLGYYYSLEVFDIQHEQEAKEMVRLIEATMKDHITRSMWLDADTRQAALIKLSKVTNLIGRPAEVLETKLSSDLSRSALFSNLEIISTARFAADMAKIGRSVDRTQWEISAATVNAFYTPIRNQMEFPAAILQPPLFDSSRPAAQNFGSLGILVGHELSHGFDSNGRLYDGDGSQRNWWTTETSAEFDRRAQCLMAQYSEFEVWGSDNGERLGQVDGNRTVTENIADNGGLGLAFDAYHRHMKGSPEGEVDDRLFFVAFAQTFCSKGHDAAVQRQLRDAHPPGHWRVNGAVMNSAVFAKTFECQANDPMNPPTKCEAPDVSYGFHRMPDWYPIQHAGHSFYFGASRHGIELLELSISIIQRCIGLASLLSTHVNLGLIEKIAGMSNQLEDDLRRILQLARAESRGRGTLRGKAKGKSLPSLRHRHQRHLCSSANERSTLLTAKLQGLSAIYGLDSNSRHLSGHSSKAVLSHRPTSDAEEDGEVLQQRLNTRRALYKQHFSGALASASGRTRELEHLLEAAAREARSSRAIGVGIGAAVLTTTQTIYAASAIETGALTLCAEHAAVLKMLTSSSSTAKHGEVPTPIVAALAICSEQRSLLPFPCGSCRELLADCGDFPVYLVNALGESEETRSSALFPRARHTELTQRLAESRPSSHSRTAACNRNPASKSTQIPMEVKDWTCEQVVRWLEQDVELPQYCEVFERNAVDGCTLLLLEASDLQLLLSITHPLHRSKLLAHVDRLRDHELLARGLDYQQLEDYLAVLDGDRISAVAQLKTTFDRLDADHDGFLDFVQLRQALTRLRCNIPSASDPSETSTQADSNSNCVEISAQAVERLLHSEELFGSEVASSGKVSFPAFARAFSKLAVQPADTPSITQGAFALHAVGPRLPVLDLETLRTQFNRQAAEGDVNIGSGSVSLDEPALVRVLQELGQTEARSVELASRWLTADDDLDEASERLSFAQFVVRYAQLMDTTAISEGMEVTGVARLHQLFTSFEPVHSARWKPRSIVHRALSTLFPGVPRDELSVWCASYWPKPPKPSRTTDSTTLSSPEFALACLTFAVEVHSREQEAASLKRAMRNNALDHHSRVVHLHQSGHVRLCPQPQEKVRQTGEKLQPLEPERGHVPRDQRRNQRNRTRKDGEDDGKHSDREHKTQYSDDEEDGIKQQRHRERQLDEAFDRFIKRHSIHKRSNREEDGKHDSEDEDDDTIRMLNAVETAQAALELDVALSREQVLRYLDREGLGTLRRRDISRRAFHRLMKRLDANRSQPRGLLLDIGKDAAIVKRGDTAASGRKALEASGSRRLRVYDTRKNYDEFLREQHAKRNGTGWEGEVDKLRREQQRKDERRRHRAKRKTRRRGRSHRRQGRRRNSEDEAKHASDDSESESNNRSSTASSSEEEGPRGRHRGRTVHTQRSQSRHKHTHNQRGRRHSHRRSRDRSSSTGTSTTSDTSSSEQSEPPPRRGGRRGGFQSGDRVASMVHGRGTIERIYLDFFVADVHFDSGCHIRNVELSGLRVLDPEDERLAWPLKNCFTVGAAVSLTHKGTMTRRRGKIIVCRTDGSFDVLVNEFGEAQTLKRVTRRELRLLPTTNTKPVVYREGARVMVRQRTEYLRGRVCACRADGSYDVKLARSPQQVLQRLAPELLAPDDAEEGDSDDEKDTEETTPIAAKKTKHEVTDDEFEPEFTRGDRVEARFGGQTAYFPGTIERVYPNGSCDITYDDGDEEERVASRLIRALPRSTSEARKTTSTPATKAKPTAASKKPAGNDSDYEEDLFESD
ncbi:hypothetical protein BBJ28_00019775, partial [Nothophytophthora sp. Chile5]